MTRKKYPPRAVLPIREVPYDNSVYWPGTNILKTNCNVFNPAIKVTPSPDWQKMQTRADVSYHASKNADSTWTTGGEFISAIHRGMK